MASLPMASLGAGAALPSDVGVQSPLAAALEVLEAQDGLDLEGRMLPMREEKLVHLLSEYSPLESGAEVTTRDSQQSSGLSTEALVAKGSLSKPNLNGMDLTQTELEGRRETADIFGSLPPRGITIDSWDAMECRTQTPRTTPSEFSINSESGLDSAEYGEWTPVNKFLADETAKSEALDSSTCSGFSASDSSEANARLRGDSDDVDNLVHCSVDMLFSSCPRVGTSDRLMESWNPRELTTPRLNSYSRQESLAASEGIEVRSGQHQGKLAVVLLVDSFRQECIVRFRCSCEVAVLTWEQVNVVSGPIGPQSDGFASNGGMYLDRGPCSPKMSAMCSKVAVRMALLGCLSPESEMIATSKTRPFAGDSVIEIVGGRHCGDIGLILNVDSLQKKYRVQLDSGAIAMIAFDDARPFDARPESLDCSSGAGDGGAEREEYC